LDPKISPEQFIQEHFFLYIAKGRINGYDGNKRHTLKSGEYCLVRKNRLARYNKEKENNEFEKVVIILDEKFLKNFQEEHRTTVMKFVSAEAFLPIRQNELIPNFIRSLMPYYSRSGRIDGAFADLKREELLIILLQNQPELSGVLFD
jgi:hypothetical protein